jgi:hypothetical protein
VTNRTTGILPTIAITLLLLPCLLQAGDATMRNVGEYQRAKIDGYGYGHQSNSSYEFVAVYCVDGYKYLIAGNREHFQNAALLQMREMRGGKEVLATCRNE